MTNDQLNPGDSGLGGRMPRHSEVVTKPNCDAMSGGAIVDAVVQLAAGLCGVALLFVWVRTIDRSTLATTEPMLAETPKDVIHPFAETRREAHIRATFREPAPSQPVAAPPATKALDGIPTAVLEKGIRFYRLRCEPCHGSGGGGDGLAASMIKPKPRTFADPSWQTSVSNEGLASAILKGGASVGRSYMMPASPDLRNKRELTDTLVRLVRSFGEAPDNPP